MFNVDFAFNRPLYGLNKAYDAEVAVRAAQRDSLSNTHALIYVKQGEAVLDDVIIKWCFH